MSAEPPNTEALLATVRANPPAAENIIASLVAELERVRAENDRFMSQNRNFKVTVDALSEAASRSQARLDRAVEALREIEVLPESRLDEVPRIVRLALAEIEE